MTAPRKIIDMDVVAESSSPFTTTIEISAQRKSRQLLIHIETLYRVVLKLEDLENPMAIATSLIVKVCKAQKRSPIYIMKLLLIFILGAQRTRTSISS